MPGGEIRFRLIQSEQDRASVTARAYIKIEKQDLKETPGDFTALNNLGILSAEYGKTSAAADYFEQIVAQHITADVVNPDRLRHVVYRLTAICKLVKIELSAPRIAQLYALQQMRVRASAT